MNWTDMINYANHGNPRSDRRSERTKDKRKKLRTKGEFYVLHEHGTEATHCSEQHALLHECERIAENENIGLSTSLEALMING